MMRGLSLIAIFMTGLSVCAPASASAMESGPVPVVVQHSPPSPNDFQAGFDLLEMALNKSEQRLIW